MDYGEFFVRATGVEEGPCPFQKAFAESERLYDLVHVPTGLGKTAMVIIGWLWRRFHGGDKIRTATPRRLVYCLPMRVLVEQTRHNAIRWLYNVGRLAGDVVFEPPASPGQLAGRNQQIAKYTPEVGDPEKVAVHILMGGEDGDDWDIHPEREAILIGTQDMLLSRALNRGYAASRSRWPMQFGLLHTDCLWVFDEIQLMGSGLATTAQLEAFRRTLPDRATDSSRGGHGCRGVWMSATMRRDWLKTVDFKNEVDALPVLELKKEDHECADKRWKAKKPLSRAQAITGDASAIAGEILQAHRFGTRTIVVVNTVDRARALYDALYKILGHASPCTRKSPGKGERRNAAESADIGDVPPQIVLLHSRFRPCDRQAHIDAALAEPADGGTIIVSTQVIEAGVDISATTLFTEPAPWASLVQRFGRCNRSGEANGFACVYWIDMPRKDNKSKELSLPYALNDLRAAVQQLKRLNEVGLASLAAHMDELGNEGQAVLFPYEHTHVIRRRDLIDLFDTTPDLAGNDIDIDRFVRDVDDSDVQVFWRTWDRPQGCEPPPDDASKPRGEEVCPAPRHQFRDFCRKRPGFVWQWNFLDKTWERANPERIIPGRVFLVQAEAGGYSAEQGWNPDSELRVEPVPKKGGEPPDATDDDRLAWTDTWQTIAEHTDEVYRTVDAIIGELPLDDTLSEVLRMAARWHDRGKAHKVFQKSLADGMPDTNKLWAKSATRLNRYERRHFRHELASALALLVQEGLIRGDRWDLVAYLVAAHHGKVRLSIRSLPNEMRPNPPTDDSGRARRFARGVWDGDELPATDLGGGISAPAVTLSLEPMELGLCEQHPFTGQPSWAERMIRLCDTLGPFRLAYLEAILRAADWRASMAAKGRAIDDEHGGAVIETKEADHG